MLTIQVSTFSIAASIAASLYSEYIEQDWSWNTFKRDSDRIQKK